MLKISLWPADNDWSELSYFQKSDQGNHNVMIIQHDQLNRTDMFIWVVEFAKKVIS